MAKKKPVRKTETDKEKKIREAKLRENEDEGKQNEDENESESEDEGKQTEDEDEGGGDDGGKDKALIQKMISQHLGDDAKDKTPQEMEALHDLGKEAYQAHKEMGCKEEEAFAHAGHALKLANHMSKKKKATESEDEGAPPPKKKPAPDNNDDDTGDGADPQEDESETESEDEGKQNEDETKESKRVKALEKRLLEAEGRLAAAEAKTKKAEVTEYADTKLKESKQPTSITKRFREASGGFKSKADFDAKWKVFLAGVTGSSRGSLDFGLMMEKSIVTESGERGGGESTGLDFSKCAD